MLLQYRDIIIQVFNSKVHVRRSEIDATVKDVRDRADGINKLLTTAESFTI